MVSIKNQRQVRRRNIHLRIRKIIKGTASCPRLSLYKSNRFLYSQLVDDEKGHTLVAASSLKYKVKKGMMADVSKVAKELSEKANHKGIGKVVFDRSGYRYHGIVKEFSKKANENGLKH